MSKLNQLTSAFLKTAPSGKHLDGLGLWYVKRPNGGSQWMLRISLGGKRREMGLGGFPDVSLKEARELAADYRKMAKQGIDPIKTRSQQRREALRPKSNLAVIAEAAYEAKKAELKNDGVNARWFSRHNRYGRNHTCYGATHRDAGLQADCDRQRCRASGEASRLEWTWF